jgi:hypothetical protein
MSWYKKVLQEFRTEIWYSALLSFVVSLAYLLWSHWHGTLFEWKPISLIEQPSLLYREFYSAFVFVTVGAFLYYVVKLWKFLYFIFVKTLHSRELYEFVKWIVWMSLILITYFYIVPVVVDILNAVISFFYNIFNLILYLSPTIGIFVILCVVLGYSFIKVRK